MKKSIDFLITQNCNYRCPYCSQSKGYTGKLQSADKKVIDSFINFLSKLDCEYEVTISGGEPLMHPDFFDIIERINQTGHRVSVVSNFSFPLECYKKIKTILGENFSELFVSLHLSEVKDKDEFINKAIEFNKIKGNTKFKIASVLTNSNSNELKEVMNRILPFNIEFELQYMRVNNAYVKYNKDANDLIKKFPVSKIKEISNTYSKICHSGINFIFVYQNGDVYRCYSSRFNKVHSMGNIKDKNFKLYSKPIPCLNKRCTCPKPILYGLIENRKQTAYAHLLSLYNFIHLPILGIKNIKIVTAKIKQSLQIKNKLDL